MEHAEAGHRFRSGKAEQLKPRRNERRIDRLHQRRDEAHARQRQGKSEQLTEDRLSRAFALGEEHEPSAEHEHQDESGGFARKSCDSRNGRAKERWPAAQTVDQPDAQQRADNLFEQFADGGRNGLADAVIIPVQHAGCAENRDARQKTQQCGQGLNVAEPQAQRLAEEKCQCGNQQADGQRKQQRTAHDANPARAFRFGAHARDGDGQARDDGRDEQHLRALRQFDKAHCLCAQLAGEPQPQQEADRTNREMRRAQKERFLNQRFTAHDHHPWSICDGRKGYALGLCPKPHKGTEFP